MGRLKEKGKAGAAKAYITRTAAVKKLQCSLADFRRLCILKGIFPREPRNKKKANKGSSAPASFYYAKDIAYLAHEPVLQKLREHKAFAKKISRALGRNEWTQAKNLDENRPVYRLDHIIKERYPTFIDAVRDIDDALCMIFLFAHLPSSSRIPPSLVENCYRLSAEWQLYIIQSKSLRKAFLSIKGVYYQAEVMGQTVTWLVPYQFTQNIPSDVDVRVMLTFLELYQTSLGFVFFKLYTDAGLVYPPPLDISMEDQGAGINAFNLQSSLSKEELRISPLKVVEVNGRQVSGKDVRHTIKSLRTLDDDSANMVVDHPHETITSETVEEDFVVQPSRSEPQTSEALPTLMTISSLPQTLNSSLFSSCTFFLSRETSRPIFEFLVRSFGGKIGWPTSSGSGSPFDEAHESITHVIIDRPLPQAEQPETERQWRLKRKYIQPQWVVDCVNAGKILLEEPYIQGASLPPHLSPFGETGGAYDPLASLQPGENDEAVEESDETDELEEDQDEDGTSQVSGLSGLKLAAELDDASAARAAELTAEAAGVDQGTFEKEMNKARRKMKAKSVVIQEPEDMNKMMMSNKQKKLYEKIKHSQNKRMLEKSVLETKKKRLERDKRREVRS